MKKTILFAVIGMALMLVSANVNAKRYYEYDRDVDWFPRNEMYIHYGTPTAMEFIGKSNNRIYDSNPYYPIVCETRNHKYSGAAGLGYNFSISPRFSFGVFGGFSWSQADVYVLGEDGKPVNEYLAYTSGIKTWSAMASAHFAWWQEGSMELSSGLYLGATYLDETISNRTPKWYGWPDPNSRWQFSYHVTAAKFRIGEIVGGFAELGFGYRGIVNIGLSVRL